MNRNATKAGKKRILVVDDKSSDTHLIKRYLEGTHEYEVREENDPLAALSIAKEFRPDLILLDLAMPGMNGEELAGHFQANSQLKDVPIVFLTAMLTKEEVGLCKGRIGKYLFLAKPIVLPEVGDCLKRQLASGASKQRKKAHRG